MCTWTKSRKDLFPRASENYPSINNFIIKDEKEVFVSKQITIKHTIEYLSHFHI